MTGPNIAELVIIVVVMVTLSCVNGDTCEALTGSTVYCVCDYKDSTGKSLGTVDLRPLVPKNPPLINQVQGEDPKKNVYSYNPCEAFSQGSTGVCTDMAACQFTPGTTNEYALGPQTSVKYSVNSGNVVFSYNLQARTATVTLKCDKDARTPQTRVLGEQQTNYYDFEITTQCACPGVCQGGVAPAPPPSSSLSTGSILCITFFVLLAAYFLGGALFNKYGRNKEGVEVIPNASFWSDLPYLIKEGFLFAISPCKKKTAYDQI